MRPTPTQGNKQGDFMPQGNETFWSQLGAMLSGWGPLLQQMYGDLGTLMPASPQRVTEQTTTDSATPTLDKTKGGIQKMLMDKYGITQDQYDSFVSTPQGQQVIREIFGSSPPMQDALLGKDYSAEKMYLPAKEKKLLERK
jgi:hypothetical protein